MAGELQKGQEQQREGEPQSYAQWAAGAATGLLSTIQSYWLQTAQQSHCWDLHVKDEFEETAKRIMPVIRLVSGHSIPQIGLGVYRSAAGDECYNAVRSALRIGYRHIDTAQVYGNEADVGRALADSGVQREEVFITSKIFKTSWGYEQANAAVRASLERLATPYLDLMLLHSPGPAETRAETWRALEECVDKGLVRSIGVSNFGIPHLKKLAETARIPPAVNQIELHPFLQWRDEVVYCQANGIVLEAYSPLAKGRKFDDPTIAELATRLGKTPAQVMICWGVQKGFVVLAKSNSPDRQASNLDVFSWALDAADMARLDGLEQGLVTGWDPIRDDPV